MHVTVQKCTVVCNLCLCLRSVNNDVIETRIALRVSIGIYTLVLWDAHCHKMYNSCHSWSLEM